MSREEPLKSAMRKPQQQATTSPKKQDAKHAGNPRDRMQRQLKQGAVLLIVRTHPQTAQNARMHVCLFSLTLWLLCLDSPGPARIIEPPDDQAVLSGTYAIFHCSAGGEGPLSFAWHQGRRRIADATGDWDAVSGSDSDTLIIRGPRSAFGAGTLCL